MEKALHVRTTGLPGSKMEIVSPELEAGQTVNVVVLRSSPAERRSAVGILAEAPGQHRFKPDKEVDDYIKEERVSWDR